MKEKISCPRCFLSLTESLRLFTLGSCLLGATLFVPAITDAQVNGQVKDGQVKVRVDAEVKAQQPLTPYLPKISDPPMRPYLPRIADAPMKPYLPKIADAPKSPNQGVNSSVSLPTTTKATTDAPTQLDMSCEKDVTRPRVVGTPTFENLILDKLTDAQKLLVTACPLDNNTVGISLYERKTGKLYVVMMDKSNFLTTGYEQQYQLGTDGPAITVKVDQPNYVNTKLIVESSQGLFIPLMVKYPIIKGGGLKEMAYYTPAHRSLQGHNFSKLGEEYIEKTLTQAAGMLKKSGYEVPDQVRKMAKLLCIVEHIDHQRFRTEEPASLFNEVLILYALNRDNCYRYSVSSAGAGGMVQMIPSTYREIRNSFPQVALVNGFEDGMINHVNAAQAMLLYLRRYSQYFLEQEIVQNAIQSKQATVEELMAAGYNSNPIRVPTKLSHGDDWKYALPRETQIYLSILYSLDSSVTTGPVEPRYHVEPIVYRPNRRLSYKAKMRLIRGKSIGRAKSIRANNRLKASIRKSTGSRPSKASARKTTHHSRRR